MDNAGAFMIYATTIANSEAIEDSKMFGPPFGLSRTKERVIMYPRKLENAPSREKQEKTEVRISEVRLSAPLFTLR